MHDHYGHHQKMKTIENKAPDGLKTERNSCKSKMAQKVATKTRMIVKQGFSSVFSSVETKQEENELVKIKQ